MNRNFISTLCCAVLCSVLFCTAGQAQTKKMSIVKAQTPLLSGTRNAVTLLAQGFSVENACNANDSKSWLLLDSTKKVLIFNNKPMCGPLFPMTFTFEDKQIGQKFYFRYKAVDSCGAMDSVEYLIQPKKEMMLTTFCYEGLSADLMPSSGEVWLSAQQFFSGDYKGINNPMLRIEGGSPGFGTTVPTAEMINTGCVGVIPIRIWAKYPNADWTFCDTYVDVQNNMGATPKGVDCPTYVACNIGMNTLRGSIMTSNAKLIENAVIALESSGGHLPPNVKDGKYSLFFIPNASFKLSVSKDDNPLNGISLFDFVLINKHILGTQNISDKYGLIAADVNNNGKVSTADALELRKMILGLQKEFSNNKSWRFFSKDMKETVVLDSIKKDTLIDFTGVKIGDINGNANPVSAPRALQTHIFKLENKELQAGEFYSLSLKGLDGFAFTLRYDVDKLELISLDENSALLENGLITTAQIESEFKATFKAKATVSLNKAFTLSSTITHAEAIVEGELQDIALQFSESETTFEAKIYPNPSDNLLHIETLQSINGEAVICNLLGQVLVNQAISESEKTTLNIAFLPQGVYLLMLKTDKGNKSVKLVRE